MPYRFEHYPDFGEGYIDDRGAASMNTGISRPSPQPKIIILITATGIQFVRLIEEKNIAAMIATIIAILR